MNPRQIAINAARKHGVPVGLFLRQMGVESGFKRGLTSPKGASGPAQIMPGTAKAWGIHNINDYNEVYDKAAQHMRGYYTQFGSWENALRAYNAGPGAVQRSRQFSETNNYVRNILRGEDRPGKGGGGAGVGSFGVTAGRTPIQTQLVSTGTKLDASAAIESALTRHLAHPGSSLSKLVLDRIQSGQFDIATHQRVRVPGVQAGTNPSEPGATAPGSRRGGYTVDPNANRAGVGLTGQLTHLLSVVSGAYGHTLEVGTGTNHSQMTVNGNVSDHWSGNAADIPANANTGAGRRKGDAIMYAALTSLGVPASKARLWVRNGGLYNVNWNGHRVQVIWKTTEGGNHFTHVHIGIK